MAEIKTITHFTLNGETRKIIDSDARSDISSLRTQLESYRNEITNYDQRIENNENTITNKETTLNTRIDSEANARRSADDILGDRINGEEAARKSADTALDTRITREAEARESADTTLNGRIDTEEDARESGDAALDSRITNEVEALNQSISNEIDIRASTDNALSNRITNEINVRKDDDDALDYRITALEEFFPDQKLKVTFISDDSIPWNKLELDERLQVSRNNLRNATIVFIGDSYGRGRGGGYLEQYESDLLEFSPPLPVDPMSTWGWPNYCIEALRKPFEKQGGSNISFINVSASGAGFVTTSNTNNAVDLRQVQFGNQLTYAKDHLPQNKEASEVNFVIIGGGYNDNSIGQETLSNAVISTVSYAYRCFPNAKVYVLPFCSGEVKFNTTINTAYHTIIDSAEKAGAITCEDSLYWLYPYENQSSSGDNIHPNDMGYRILGQKCASFISGGNIPGYTVTWAQKDEGYLVAPETYNSDGTIKETAATNNGFRCGVTNNMAWASGSFKRQGYGNLCRMPSYLVPVKTTYLIGFAYANSTHHGAARIRIAADGWVNFFTLESGTYNDNLTYTIWLPPIMIPLGHNWQ